MLPSSGVSTDKSFVAAQNEVQGGSFLLGECLSLRQAESWLLAPSPTSCVTSSKEMKIQSPHLSDGDNHSLPGWLWEFCEAVHVSFCPTSDQHSLSLPLSFLVLALPYMGQINEWADIFLSLPMHKNLQQLPPILQNKVSIIITVSKLLY